MDTYCIIPFSDKTQYHGRISNKISEYLKYLKYLKVEFKANPMAFEDANITLHNHIMTVTYYDIFIFMSLFSTNTYNYYETSKEEYDIIMKYCNSFKNSVHIREIDIKKMEGSIDKNYSFLYEYSIEKINEYR